MATRTFDRSALRKRSVTVAGHATSVSLEQPFWEALAEIAQSRRTSVNGLVAEIDACRVRGGLSSAIRLFVLEYYRARASAHSSDRQVVSAE